jgi:hypothetical protein
MYSYSEEYGTLTWGAKWKMMYLKISTRITEIVDLQRNTPKFALKTIVGRAMESW